MTTWRRCPLPPFLCACAPLQYAQAISSVGAVLEYYDSDKLFPVLGFGGCPVPGAPPLHCFAVNGQENAPEVHGIDGILHVYRYDHDRNVVRDGCERESALPTAVIPGDEVLDRAIAVRILVIYYMHPSCGQRCVHRKGRQPCHLKSFRQHHVSYLFILVGGETAHLSACLITAITAMFRLFYGILL